MGMPLIEKLNDCGSQVFVTSRYQHNSTENIHYLCDNAYDAPLGDTQAKI